MCEAIAEIGYEISKKKSFHLDVSRLVQKGDNWVNINFRFMEHVIWGHFKTTNKFVKFQS